MLTYDRLKNFRKLRKLAILHGFGGKCQCCGYKKCVRALEFHHLDCESKDFSISTTINKSWNEIKNELKKCICVCANCHREIHDNLRVVDTNKQYFDETAVKDYETTLKKIKRYNKCPICGTLKPEYNKFCSPKCAAKSQEKVDWSQYEDLVCIIDTKAESINSIAKKLNVSWQTVKKRYKKLKLLGCC